MKTKSLLTLLLMLFAMGAKADDLQIVTSPVDGCFTIAGSMATDKAILLYDDQDAEVVTTVIDCLLSDLKAVTKKTFMKYKTEPTTLKNPIIVGTIGQSSHIDQLIADGKIDVSDVVGKWEAFGMQVIDNPMEGVAKALVIFGAHPRATAYGMFHLSRMMGVSPWIWWADVTPTTKTQLYVTPGRYISGTPSVKFRGIFLNDEDYGLRPWAAKKMDTNLNNFGPKTYAAIMELLLRLRANTLWPAMHAGSRAFWFEKTNIPLIMKYDIYMGSSHCEQMLRDNEYEWGKTGDKFGGHGNEDWVWHSNQDMIKRYWAERVGESRGKNAIYTLGMRGIHDSGINGYNTTEERVAALTDIIAYQRQLLADSIGDPTTIPQIFIPYKEVLTCYNAGLQVPEDVTLMWVDDNHGYIRQMPTPAEQARSGGNAIYYHISYWGSPASYLWLSTLSPSLCSYELCKAYDQGVRDQWIINVGDIKPGEEELEFCMDLAWDINSWQPEQAHLYTRDWAARTFGEDVADDINEIKMGYYRLGIAAKPEHVQLCHFDHSNAEIDARIEEYQDLYQKTVALRSRIPSSLRNAYYELIEYPVCACTDQNIKLLRARQSFLYAWAGQEEKALSYSTAAQNAFEEIKTLTTKYNTGIASGKWQGMMDYKPNNWSQHLMPAVATADDVAEQESSILQPNITILAGGSYTNASSTVKTLEGLGIEGTTATVWPLDMQAYTSANDAPYAEYTLPVQKGLNVIQVRCLPTFPINTSYDLRAGVSVDGKAASVLSIKVSAMTDTWDETVAQGYYPVAVHYTSTEDKTVSVRVSFMDPGLCVSAVASIPFSAGTEDLTSLLTNPDFEYGNNNALNPQGGLVRGVPRGWKATGTMSGNSWGINQDAKHRYGINIYWASSKPMPNTYELSQTIAASKLGAGTYLVTCLLGTQTDKMANCRLFANKNVQYYGAESDYLSSMLTSGETNTFAGYSPSSSGKMTLHPMAVMVTLKDGESLKLGIRTSNFKTDGTRSTNDSHGWFKVDHFRLQRIDAQEDPDAIKPTYKSSLKEEEVYDLNGYKIGSLPSRGRNKGVYVMRRPDGSVVKLAR
ncbi:MAG: glycosyl hydrolase 115 family protein [Bacteroidaceae bacterium]|nr:glycosyl hydrolase 115 family protein [Bacteroidaceae bacterium]